MSSFAESLREEVGRLERELEASPVYVKLREAKRLLGLYLDAPAVNAPVAPSPAVVNGAAVQSHTRPGPVPRVRDRNKRSAYEIKGTAGRAAQAVVRLLTESGTPMFTPDLLSKLEEQGIHMGGSIPVNNLSSLLSRTAEVMAAEGRKGWRLVTEADDEELADSDDPEEETLPANEPQSTPVEPGEEVAHDLGPG